MINHPIFPLPCAKRGLLLLTPCPGTQGVTLETSLLHLKAAGATVILTLMTKQELHRYKLDRLPLCSRAQGLRWFHLPIVDDAAPDGAFLDAWEQCKDDVHQRLDNNEAIVIHCKGGSGRTGLVAAQILIERGESKADTISRIQALRPNAFSRQVQREYIAHLL
ncbi:protein-tyrosine phosphatase family protein [Marinagarivorans algicola]|uniref:phosphatase domain-containing putative toxin n=1 Tax=Marinagarivorans algicola TaxID=1513270 RepID=UPI0009E9635D|nr:protein-tyrosine phosphatase family protein [Marinagarivorans algicola]